MKVLLTGSHGLIGSALGPALEASGHQVVRLVRGPAGRGEVSWDPATGTLDASSLSGVDAAVHLAGAGIGDKRWTPARKQEVLDSRVKSTDLLSQRLASLDPKPQVLVGGSAIGFYGDRGDERLTEESPPGKGFLVGLVEQWEGATAPASDAGIRVVHIRSGIVQSAAGGALGKVLPLFKFGLGGRIGSGKQYWSWIALDDEVGAIIHALTTDSLRGAVNLTAPNPVTNAEYTKTLARVLGRPALIPTPRFGLAAVVGGEAADEMLIGGARVLPERLSQSGYKFQYPELEGALKHELGR
jgi:uncharacterized protein (TIGR01777 family)